MSKTKVLSRGVGDMVRADQIISVREDGSIDVGTTNFEPTLTQQQYIEDCDVNNIIAKYRDHGEWTHLARKEGVFADVSEVTDYQGALDAVHKAERAFLALPGEVRARFGHDPGKLLEFIQDPRNYEEGVQLGIFDKKADMATDAAINKNDLNKNAKAKDKPKNTPVSDAETPE